MADYDYKGWATRINIKCADGRTIMDGAFKECDGQTVPLVWQHQHNEPENVLGHALLEYVPKKGVYSYLSFNDTKSGRNAKELVDHGDVSALSIYANQLKQQNGNVMHGTIREVSLVLAGANPGAFIEYPVLEHGEENTSEAFIYLPEDEAILSHADDGETETDNKNNEGDANDMAKNDDRTVQDVFDEFTDEQKKVVYFLISKALEDAGVDEEDVEDEDNEDGEDEEDMRHNAFSAYDDEGEYLSHADMEEIFADAKRVGSLKDAVLEHGITDIDMLFPEDHNLNPTPEFIKRDQGWVSKVMGGVKHTPFSRIRSTFANITADEARARGYIKGHLKKEEVITLLKRSTDPQTIYKKQKLDRDDVIDITDFDVVAWLKAEMRMMLDEEIARAILIGDGRNPSDDDHIKQEHVRAICNDADLYTIKVAVASTDPKVMIRAIIKARKNYKGSGSPTFFTTEDILTDMLLLEANDGRPLYADEAALARKLRVKEIVTVPVMENATATVPAASGTGTAVVSLYGIVVNLADYNVGADKGGAVNMFDDFDIDYNQQKYLIETRISGALIKPYAAMAIVAAQNGQQTDNTEPETGDNTPG